MVLDRASKVTTTESLLFGFLLGMLLGTVVEWQNYLAGNFHWINYPESVGVLGTVVFGTVSLGLLLGYGVFGATLAVLVYMLASSVDVEKGRFGTLVGILAFGGGVFMVLVNAQPLFGVVAAIVGLALIIKSLTS